jgi:hypothetical protein
MTYKTKYWTPMSILDSKVEWVLIFHPVGCGDASKMESLNVAGVTVMPFHQVI